MITEKKLCGFCKGKPVGNAATWVDGKPRPPAPCPRCGETNYPTTEIETLAPAEIANPITGEIIDVADPGACALAIAELRRLEDRIREVKRVLGATLVNESLRLGAKTLHLPGADVTLTEKTTIVWDLEKLGELRDLGLPEERWTDLVRTTVEEKVNAFVAKQIAGANESYAAVIAAARTDHVGERYVVDVKRGER